MRLTPGTRKLHSRVFAIVAGVVFVLGVVSSAYTYTAIDVAGREHILDRTRALAEMLPKEELRQLVGTEADVENPAYISLKQLLTNVRGVNSDVRFIYLIGNREELFFYLDSEDPSSEDYSPPGQIYPEAPWQMREVFKDGVARSDGPTQDRWGVWISAYAPIYIDGRVAAILGIDLPAETFIGNAVAYAALPLLISLLIIVLLLVAQRVRAREEEALEQRAEFLSIASHEIRTPLTGVRWALEDLISSKEISRDSLIQIHDVATRLVERVNNLLDVTRLEQRGIVKKGDVLMRALIEDVARSFTLSASQKKVSIVIEESVPAQLTLYTDENLMRHVFFNLISNGVKYTREGSEVRVSYERVGDSHAFSVEDQGVGIPEHDRKDIFRGYHRAQTHEHAGIEGTGLGLYLVEKAVRMAGGKVALTDGAQGGARFTITLPRQ